MPVTIKNLTQRPVLIRLNSGATLHLAPAAISAAIPDGERVRNAKIEKLVKRRVISLEEQKPAPKVKAKKAREPMASSKPAARARKQQPATRSS